MKARNEAIRHECHLQLYGAQARAQSVVAIRKKAARDGDIYPAASDSEIETALFFLVGQKLAEEIQDPATGQKLYRITSAGTLHWENTESH